MMTYSQACSSYLGTAATMRVCDLPCACICKYPHVSKLSSSNVIRTDTKGRSPMVTQCCRFVLNPQFRLSVGETVINALTSKLCTKRCRWRRPTIAYVVRSVAIKFRPSHSYVHMSFHYKLLHIYGVTSISHLIKFGSAISRYRNLPPYCSILYG